MDDFSMYDLTEEEYQECLLRAEQDIFLEAQSVEHPRSIFVVAQPGAGKTALRTYLVSEAQRSGGFLKFLEFNPDKIALHHKHYSEVIAKHPDHAYRILQKFTGRALDEYLRRRAIDVRCDMMQEGTFASTAAYIDILEFQKNGGTAPIGRIGSDGLREQRTIEGGYEIDINILAVNRFESLLSCFEREEFFMEKGLPPRAVTIENHDRAYDRMLETIGIVENRGLFDQMRVFRRGYIEQSPPQLIYSAGDPRYPSVAEAIRNERAMQEVELFRRPELYLARIADLRRKIEGKGNESLVKRLDALEELLTMEQTRRSNRTNWRY
ncbi:MAG: zeta toxin family protein [Clostridia bacterium]|nr:zeta toxin family protein [Clostridia bacterium]